MDQDIYQEITATDPFGIIACSNNRNRYFIPSVKYEFGIFTVEYLKFDTGCNSLLLPFKKIDTSTTPF